MPWFLTRRSTGEPPGAWGDLSPGDRKLIGQLVAIAAVSTIALLAAGRHAERVVFESESRLRSAHVVETLHDDLLRLSDLVSSGRPTAEDLAVIRQALQAGEAFRYTLYNAQGRVVVASRKEDVGKRSAETSLREILRTGRGFFRIDRGPSAGISSDTFGGPSGDQATVVGKRYVPIMQGPRVLGVIEIDLDMTALDRRLQSNTKGFVAGLLAMFGTVGAASAAAFRRNIRERRRAMQQLAASRQRAETLAREANRMLDNLLACEEEKISRIVALVDGISHEIGNPLATLSMGLDGLEASCRRSEDGDCEAPLADMRDALDRVAAFLHGLTTLSLVDQETHQDVDVNEVIQSLAALVQLNDRSRGVVFALNLPSDIASLSLPLRSVALSLFMILSAAAESVQRSGGRIEVETAMSAAGDGVQLRIVASGAAPGASPSRASSTSPLEPDHPALATAKRIIESLGGRMVLSARAPAVSRCELTFPLRPVAARS